MNVSLIGFLIMAAVAAVIGAIIAIGDLLANQPTRSTDATKKPPPTEWLSAVEQHSRQSSPALFARPSNHAGRTRSRSRLDPEGIPSGPRTMKCALADLSEKLADLPQNHRKRPELARMICHLEAELEDRERRS
jgi:hypothetical protein